MSTVTASVNPPPASASYGSKSLQIVLFGMPDAGKSSILGGLAQAALTQERILQGRLLNVPAGLEELRRRVYEDRTRETLDEIVPYPLVFEPFQGTQSNPVHVPLIIYDCDGRVANELLTRRKSFDADAKRGSLARAVLEADALILVVDASASSEQIDADFREFIRFLRFLREHRTDDRMVGGMPVYLVLSKCDLLALEHESLEQWQYRIHDRKQKVYARFDEFLKTDMPAGSNNDWLAFGSLSMGVYATATMRPRLADQTVQPTTRPEPVGIAELFHTCIQDARAYRARLAGSGSRLGWTLLLSVILLVGMLTTAGIVLTQNREADESPLLAKIRSYQSSEGQTPSQRLTEQKLLPLLRVLTELRNDPDFPKLPGEPRKYVEKRIAEMEEYRKFRDVLESTRSPADAITIKELDRVEQVLNGLQVPDAYKVDWSQTEAVQLRNKWVKDIPLLRDAVNKVTEWYRDLVRQGNGLLFTNSLEGTWQRDVQALLQQDQTPKFREGDRIADSESLLQRRGNSLTYSTAYSFDVVEAARRQWESVRDKLSQLSDMANALGITGDERSERAVLVFAASDVDSDIVTSSIRRLALLKKFYPRYREWSLATLPDPIRPEIQRRLSLAYAQLVRDGQILILKKLATFVLPGKETHTDWLKIVDWLTLPTNSDIREYRDLLIVVEQLLKPGELDGITRLVTFLRKETFELEFRVIRVHTPDKNDPVLRPNGPLIIYHQPVNGGTSALRFVIDDEGARDGSGFYRFKLDGNDQKNRWTFRPGDAFWSTLPLRDGSRDLQFTWSNDRTRVYQFDRLKREPQLSLANGGMAIDQRVADVDVEVLPTGGLPVVPELLPNVSRPN